MEQEVRFAQIEVTLGHLNEAVHTLNGHLATIQLTIFGLFAVFLIPIIVLIIQIIVDSVITFTQDSVRLQTAPTGGCADIFGFYYKTQLGILRNDVSRLENKVDGLSITTRKHLNQIREALAVQLGIVLNPEDEN